ncbi:hypothetical protein HYE03_00930 [Mycoplasmopsis bovis]|nr:hypothetical protein [Mycoplasmopsis bovis]QQH27983.1 hypothetical protein HYE03_00930 [Mycoplasmopsis bovis]
MLWLVLIDEDEWPWSLISIETVKYRLYDEWKQTNKLFKFLILIMNFEPLSKYLTATTG